jgi:hypothetical protein
MAVQPLLCRLVVVRRNDQRPVGPCLFGMLREGHRLCRAIRAGPGNHGNPAIDHLNGQLDHAMMFLMR